MRPEPAVTLEYRSDSRAKEKRNPETSNVLPWPIPLGKSEPSPFLRGEQLSLFSENCEIDVTNLRRKEAARAAQMHAEGTQRGYDSSFKSFAAFCEKTGRTSLPSTPSTVTLYLTYESTQGLATGTITRRLVAISDQHKRAGYPSPCAYPEVRDCLKRIRRELGTASKPKLPIWPDDLKAMLAAVGDTTRALRDRALLLFGFASGMRRGELVALDIADVRTQAQGLEVHIRRSKVDQFGAGRLLGVQRGERKATCPVRTLESWIAVRGRQPGPLFSQVLRSGNITGHRLSGAAVARILKQAATRVGLDATAVSAHSLRSGCATSAAAAGADIKSIADRLGHASCRTTERYIRHGSLFSVNPLKGVL